MKNDYPKMLYMGHLAAYQTVIAESEDHEFDLKEQGWLEYGELEEGQISADLSAPNTTENEFIASLENEVSFLKDELIKSENQNKTLVHKLRIKELEDLKVDELKKILTEKEISFNVSDGKPVLIDLIANSELPQSL